MESHIISNGELDNPLLDEVRKQDRLPNVCASWDPYHYDSPPPNCSRRTPAYHTHVYVQIPPRRTPIPQPSAVSRPGPGPGHTADRAA